MEIELLDQRIVVESQSPELIAELRHCVEEVDSQPEIDVSAADLHVRVSSTLGAVGSNESSFGVTARSRFPLRLTRIDSPGAAWQLSRALVQWAVDAAPGHYIFHAGSIERDGSGILIPGATCAGKTSLTLALANRGFAVLSDEVGAIRYDDGAQVGVGRALSIRDDVIVELDLEDKLPAECKIGETHVVRACELGFECGSTAQTAMVVAPVYRPRERTRLRPLRTAEAILRLYEASCSQPRWKVAGLDFVIDLATRVPCHELTYSDATTGARLIDEAFSQIFAASHAEIRSRSCAQPQENANCE